jgi:hypothetical protein
MRLIENGVIGRRCHECQKLILYGAKFYHNSKSNIDYCFKCGKSQKQNNCERKVSR